MAWYLPLILAAQRKKYGTALEPARLRAHFDEQAIVELAALIAFQNMSSKFNGALAVPAAGFSKGRRPS